MPKLNNEDRRRLVNILASLPLLNTQRARYQILELAGLKSVTPQINLEGEPFVVSSQIVQVLESYGRISYEYEALGVFLNTVKELVGSASDEQKFIEYLLIQYRLMVPIIGQDDIRHWNGVSDTQDVLEKIIGENTLRHISFLRRGLEVSSAVALIDVGDWVGTGFMVSPNLIMTNNHVLPNKELLPNTVFRFNYQLTFEGTAEKTQDFRAQQDGLFHTNTDLDYSVIELEDSPGEAWAIVPVCSVIPSVGSRVNIIQHPAGQPKQISLQNNFVEYSDHAIVQYLTSTLNGSSGSPVFDDQWRAIALHHAGGMIMEPGANTMYFRNEGVAMAAILDDLPAGISEQLLWLKK